MSSSLSHDSLNGRLAALHEERLRNWAPEALAVNIGQRRTLRDEHDTSASIQVGKTFPNVTLSATDDSKVSIDDLVKNGPAVLIFFRFAGCPACNIAIPYYRDTLATQLRDAGITLAAISPQPAPLLHDIVERQKLPFIVLSDDGLALSRQLGITYSYDDASRAVAIGNGTRSEDLNGTSAWELPKPTVIVLDQNRVVDFIDVSPDWMARTESTDILNAALSALERSRLRKTHAA